MNEQYVVNQHYISQCLLKQFANSKNQVIETLVEVGKTYPTNYKNSMVERFTYEHPVLGKNRVERYFQRIEDYFGPAVEVIIKTIEKSKDGNCSFSDVKQQVSKYMREFLIFYYRSRALLTEFEFERTDKGDRVFLMLEKIMNSQYIKGLSNTVTQYYDFAIIESENNEFLLSDQYLSTAALAIKNRFFNMSNRHIGLRDVMLLLPLSGKFYAVFYNGQVPQYISSARMNTLNRDEIDEINEVIINNSYIKCVTNNREAIERVAYKFVYESPSATYAGGNGTVMGATLKKEVFFYGRDKRTWQLFTENEWTQFRDLKRNDMCACGSGKKFKKCCVENINICKRMYEDIVYKHQNYQIADTAIVEKSITEFASKELKKP